MSDKSPFDQRYTSLSRSATSDIHNSNKYNTLELQTVQMSVTSARNPNLLETLTPSFPRRPRSAHRVPATRYKRKSISIGEEAMVMVNDEDKSQRKTRNIKYERVDESKRELEGVSVIYVNGEEVDLKFLARELQTVQMSVTSARNPNLLETLTPSFPRRPRSAHRVPATRYKRKSISIGEEAMVMVNDEDKSQRKTRNIKYERVDESKRELEGVSVIYVNGEEVDLKFLAREADGAYEEELASMTERMSRAKLIGFMESLEGEWCGSSERRRVVDAAEFVKALPIDWKIELALCDSTGLPSIYCRRYVSPSGIRFKSCKDAAIYLRNQSLKPEEQEMRQINNGCHTLAKSGNRVNIGSSEDDVSDLYDVKVATLIECSPCGIAFQDMRGLEKHLGTFHKETTRRFDLPIRGLDKGPRQHADMDNEAQKNGEATSISQKIGAVQESVARFRTTCTWCNKEFLSDPVDTQTMADATGFMCPKCKDKISGPFERSLLKLKI